MSLQLLTLPRNKVGRPGCGEGFMCFSLALPIYLNDAFKAFVSRVLNSLFNGCSISTFQHPWYIICHWSFLYPCLCSTSWRSPQLHNDSLHSAPAFVSPSAGMCWHKMQAATCIPHLDTCTEIRPSYLYNAFAWHSFRCSQHVLRNSIFCPLGAHWIMLNPIERIFNDSTLKRAWYLSSIQSWPCACFEFHVEVHKVPMIFLMKTCAHRLFCLCFFIFIFRYSPMHIMHLSLSSWQILDRDFHRSSIWIAMSFERSGPGRNPVVQTGRSEKIESESTAKWTCDCGALPVWVVYLLYT